MCASRIDLEFKIRAGVVNVNSDEPTFYSYIVKINKSSGFCSSNSDPYVKRCIHVVVEKINIRVFNLI